MIAHEMKNLTNKRKLKPFGPAGVNPTLIKKSSQRQILLNNLKWLRANFKFAKTKDKARAIALIKKNPRNARTIIIKVFSQHSKTYGK